jgi:hypothetical protein
MEISPRNRQLISLLVWETARRSGGAGRARRPLAAPQRPRVAPTTPLSRSCFHADAPHSYNSYRPRWGAALRAETSASHTGVPSQAEGRRDETGAQRSLDYNRRAQGLIGSVPALPIARVAGRRTMLFSLPLVRFIQRAFTQELPNVVEPPAMRGAEAQLAY